MSFDLTGNNGAYLGMSNRHWWPLWTFCEQVAPELTVNVRDGYTNDGDGLGEADALALAEALRTELTSGRVAEYKARLYAEIDALPDITCPICNGAGERFFAHENEVRPCNWCHGARSVRPPENDIDFSVAAVRAFADFLERCGGFAIL